MKKYESELMKSLHEEAEYFHSKGIISDTEMKGYDKDCLLPATETSGAGSGGKPPMAASGSNPRGRNIK
jgi:DNA-binding transcriptional regulator YiaG